jgi:hypothetical protein
MRVRLLPRLQAVLAAGLLVAGGAAWAFSAGASPTQAKAPAVQASTPTPVPSSRGMLAQPAQLPMVGLPAPGALHYTTDIGACKRAGGNDGTCGALLNQNAVAFFFTWSCGPNCVITGFKLKDASRAPSGPTTVMRVITDPMSDALDTATGTLFIERPPQGGWASRCYVVTAYRAPVAKLVPDGSGGLKPSGPATGSYQESPPSAKACVASLTKEVSLPAAKIRNFGRIYFLNQNTPKTTGDDPPQNSSYASVGKMNMSQQGFSVVNKFYRAGASFDLSPLGDVTVYGGRFAYDASQDCRPRLYAPAPANWESSSFPRATGSPLAWSGSPGVGALVRGWRAPRRLTFLLMESTTEGMDAEDFNYGAAMIGSCRASGQNVRLVLDVGVTK